MHQWTAELKACMLNAQRERACEPTYTSKGRKRERDEGDVLKDFEDKMEQTKDDDEKKELLKEVYGPKLVNKIKNYRLYIKGDLLQLVFDGVDSSTTRIVLTAERFEKSRRYFSMSSLLNDKNDIIESAIDTFYDAPTPDLKFNKLLFGYTCIDIINVEDEPRDDVYNLPIDYLNEFTEDPWYFYRFNQALKKRMLIEWPPQIQFDDFATNAMYDLGWSESTSVISHDIRFAAYNIARKFQPQESELEAFRANLLYKESRVVAVENAADYVNKYRQWKTQKILQNRDERDVDVLHPQKKDREHDWAVFIYRTKTENELLSERLKTDWQAYIQSKSLEKLVRVIQLFNNNHYFVDFNGRLSMLLIQLHMYHTEKDFILFYDHNPNGPCAEKYVQMLRTAPRLSRISVTAYTEAYTESMQQYEKAMKVECTVPTEQ